MATKEDKAKLAKGAKKIQNAQKTADAKKPAKPEPVVIPQSSRDIKEILRDRVQVLDGSIGVKLADETPIEECLRIMDWATTMSDHVGFMIGDIINFGQAKWGEKYAQAMEQTGRKYSTVAQYAQTARRIPVSQRRAELSFTAHREILRLGDDAKAVKLVQQVGDETKAGKITTTKQLRDKITKLTPRKTKTPKRATSGKGKKTTKKVLPPPYKPSEAEEEKLEEAYLALEEANKLVPKLLPLIGRLDNRTKNRWLKLAQPFAVFYKNLENITGYETD